MSLSLIRTHLQTAGEHVGDMLWWTLEDARISRARLEQVWNGAGLATALLPEPPTPEKALRTAVREAAVGQQGHLIRLGKEDDDELVFAVVEEQRDGAGNVSYRQEARIVLRKLGTPVLGSDAPEHELVRDVRERYERLLTTHTPDDVRRALVKTLASCAAVTLREHGGVYFHEKAKAHLYHSVLQVQVSDLDGRLDELTRHVEGMLQAKAS
jgi:hypothetical protein